MAIEKTFAFWFEAIKISEFSVFCFTIIATELTFSLITSKFSVVNTIVSSLVVLPKSIKFELIVKSPLTTRLLLYILSTINLFLASDFSLIISVVKSVILFEIILLVDST